MKNTQLRARYWRIMAFFTRVTLDFIFWEIILARMGFRRISRRNRAKRLKDVAARFRRLAIRMGGVMIKVGQFLSSRLDVLPREITDELAGLQDEVPAEPFEAIRTLAEADLGGTLKDKFEWLDETPLAAASLGQVHRARLCSDGQSGDLCNVVVKIQRPNIDQLIEVDLSAIRRVGGWLARYKPVAKRVDVPALIQEFAETIRQEVDYLAEGKNAEVFAENFKDSQRVQVPRVVWSHTTKKVLTLEDVFAIKITDYAAITAAGIDRSEVADELLDTYLKQIFEDGFFHADPHPGNLFVTPGPMPPVEGQPAWRLTFVDFGMVGHVPDNLQTALKEVLISVGTRDAARLVRSYQTLNILLPSADLAQMERATAQVFGLFWGKSMEELRQMDHRRMFQFAEQFRDLMYEMPFQLPENLLLLGRTVAILSGMCTGLYPEFNLWEHLTPYASKLIEKEGGSNWKTWLDEAGNLLKELIALPSQAARVMMQVERGDLVVQAPLVNHQIRLLERSVNRLAGSVVFAALFLGGVFFYSNGKFMPAWVSLGAAGLTLLGMLLSNRRGPGNFHP